MSRLSMKALQLKCDSCEKSFGKKITFETHIKTIHEDNKAHRCDSIAYNCDSCDKRFGSKGDLKRHFKTIHENSRPYKCESCGKSFGRKSDLINLKDANTYGNLCGLMFVYKNYAELSQSISKVSHVVFVVVVVLTRKCFNLKEYRWR